jgi:hypothetical protein
MVQIFKVNEFSERKRLLQQQSDLYRRMLATDGRNIEMSVKLLRRKYNIIKNVVAAVSVATSVAGLVLAARGSRKPAGTTGGGAGWMSRLLSGMEIMNLVRGAVAKFKAARSAFSHERE